MDWIVSDAETGEVKGMGKTSEGAILDAALHLSADQSAMLADHPAHFYVACLIGIGDYTLERIALRH
jgi:hypothetical protein